MTASENAVRQLVAQYLSELGEPFQQADGRLSLPAGSSRVFIQVGTHPSGENTVIDIMAPVLFNAPASPALFERIATDDSFVFGRYVAVIGGNGTVNVVISHRLLGNDVAREALLHAVAGIAVSADTCDEELKQQFGGQTFFEL